MCVALVHVMGGHIPHAHSQYIGGGFGTDLIDQIRRRVKVDDNTRAAAFTKFEENKKKEKEENKLVSFAQLSSSMSHRTC